MFGGQRICRWFILFREIYFEVVVNLGKHNMGPHHLSRLESGESGGSVDDDLPDVHLFLVEVVLIQFKDIKNFLTTRKVLENYTHTQQ
jgi:hypothetical protein